MEIAKLPNPFDAQMAQTTSAGILSSALTPANDDDAVVVVKVDSLFSQAQSWNLNSRRDKTVCSGKSSERVNREKKLPEDTVIEYSLVPQPVESEYCFDA